jgi:hypothetical protein
LKVKYSAIEPAAPFVPSSTRSCDVRQRGAVLAEVEDVDALDEELDVVTVAVCVTVCVTVRSTVLVTVVAPGAPQR